MLRPLVLSVDFSSEANTAAGDRAHHLGCAFCGMRSGRWQRFVAALEGDQSRLVACPLCLLPQQLQRPSIDEEAALIWLPEMSQAALNVTIREVHIQLRTLGDDLYKPGRRHPDGPERQKLYHARAALSARRATAAGRLGTDKPSELAGALYRLSPGASANRAKLLGGVRLLPLGRFYDRGRDVYPEIVDAWRELAAPSFGRPAPLSGA